jgi:tetratricopeptide (TPR) repeat protein
MTSDETYELAANAVRRKQYKKAINYFSKLLKKDPEYIKARRGLRAVQVTVVEESKIPAVLKAPHLFIKMKMLMAKKKYDETIVACEEFLNRDPANISALRTLLKCATELEYHQTAMFTHESLAELNPSDANIVIEAAEYLSDLGTKEGYDKANKLMTNLVNLDPEDTDLSAYQGKIAAKKSINTIETAQNTSDVLANKDEAKELEQETQEIRSDDDLGLAIERAIKRDEEDPDNPRHKETVGNLLFRKTDYLKAAEYFKTAIELDENNQNAHARLSDTKMKILEIQISKMVKRKAKMKEIDEKKQQSQRIKVARKKLIDLKHNECKRKLKVNPNDLGARFDMGELFFSLKKIDLAIQQFQRSCQDANLSFKSCEYLGHCFKTKKLYDMAIKEYNNAYNKPGVKSNDQLNVLNEIGDCYVETKKLPEALDIFKKILEKDFGFKDISEKVQQLQEKLDSK